MNEFFNYIRNLVCSISDIFAHSFYDIYVRDNIRFDEYDYSYESSNFVNEDINETNLHLEDDIPKECIPDDLGEKNEGDGKMLI